jgi:hypothetical protein
MMQKSLLALSLTLLTGVASLPTAGWAMNNGGKEEISLSDREATGLTSGLTRLGL